MSSQNTTTPNWISGLSGIVAALGLLAPMFLSAQTYNQPKLNLTTSHNQVELQFRGPTNQIFEIEVSTNLVDWAGIAQRAGGNGPMTIAGPSVRVATHFYRVVQPDAKPGSASAALGLGSMGATGCVPDRILVKPKAGVSLGGLNLSLGLSVLQAFPSIGNLQVVKVPPSMTASTLIAYYLQSGLAQYAEPDFYVHAMTAPDDPYYTNLWAFHNAGQFGGNSGADIDAEDAWAVQHDAANIVVAVVDTGVRYTHEDLAANMWVNPADGSHGTNVVAGNTDPDDDYGHGTHVAGIIGAVGDNNRGVAGVAWHVQIMACKFLDSQGNGTIDGAIACLEYAREHGANIVNASWGATNFTSQALYDAVGTLRDAGIMFVAAAGNSGEDNEVNPIYPASYADLDNVIAVAGTDEGDVLASWSNYGLTNVDLAAPGTLIYSCWNGSDTNYQYEDGTSMSCAMTAGAAAVVEAHFPGENYQQIKQQLLANVDPLPSLQGKCISGGRLNLYRALTDASASGLPLLTLEPNTPDAYVSGEIPGKIGFHRSGDTNSSYEVYWTFSGTASNGVDYELLPTNYPFPSGAADTYLTITPINHRQTNDMTVIVTLAPGAAYQIGSPKSSTVIIHGAQSGTGPTASFTASPTNGQAPLTVQFIDTSTGGPTNLNWTFGDGTTSAMQNPSHTYNSTGTYTASLTVTGSSGQTSTASQAIVVTNASASVTASFAANPTSGQAPLSVQFTDQSSGPVASWSWNFGDGATSGTESPSHTYSSAGTYTASLTVTGGGQTNSASQTIIVTNASASVTASFAANPTSGQAPLSVQFTDQSSGPVASWSWNFGDGATSSAESPSHTYSSAGTYTASLTVTGGSGQTSSARQTIQVTNAPAPVTASFAANPTSGQAPLSVQFSDQSSGPVVSWNWNFGDGATSSAESPSHTYSSAGTYTASLTVTGGSGQTSSARQTIVVTAAPAPVTASFAASPTSGQAPLLVQFTDQSSGPVVSWNWNFGDGATSSTESPSHTYSNAGTYTASLTVTGGSGQTSTASQAIVVTTPPPPPSATVTVVATQPLATSLTPGVFSISRSGGGTGSALTVNYSLSGTAQNGTDYETLSGTATIPAGTTTATVVVHPLGLLNLLETVVLTVSPDSSYSVGSPSSATVEIVASLSL